MSGIKDANLSAFYRSLHARGQTITDLAEALNCGRSHLSQVLNGRRPGKPTWRKIIASELLTDHELSLLGRIASHGSGRATGPVDGAPSIGVPRATNSHMEHEPQGVAV